MLDWSLLDLARAARLSVATVKRLEDGPPGSVAAAAEAAVRGALEGEGVVFLTDEDGQGRGLRVRLG